jgi:DNA-directed RNA polymerase subunit RPC12/RpoP
MNLDIQQSHLRGKLKAYSGNLISCLCAHQYQGKHASHRGVMSLSINGVSLDFRDRALEAAEYKCYKCGSDVNDNTAMFSYIVPEKNGGQASQDNIQVSCPKCELLTVENLFSSFTSPAVESAVRLWIHSYLKSPFITVIISLVIGVASSFGVNQIMNTKSLTPKSLDVKRGRKFASFCKFCDAFYGQVDLIVMSFYGVTSRHSYQWLLKMMRQLMQ